MFSLYNSYRSTVLFLPLAAPCPPSQLNASVNCANNTAMLTWNSSPNAVSYTGKAVSTDGHNVTCDAETNLGCQLKGLQCGKKYTFTVSASDGNCQSNDSQSVIRTTGESSPPNPGQHVSNFFSNYNSSFSLLILFSSSHCTSSWMCP